MYMPDGFGQHIIHLILVLMRVSLMLCTAGIPSLGKSTALPITFFRLFIIVVVALSLRAAAFYPLSMDIAGIMSTLTRDLVSVTMGISFGPVLCYFFGTLKRRVNLRSE